MNIIVRGKACSKYRFQKFAIENICSLKIWFKLFGKVLWNKNYCVDIVSETIPAMTLHTGALFM